MGGDDGHDQQPIKKLLNLARGAGLAALIATHNPDLAGRMDRIVRIQGGHLVEV